ncbi:SPOR domain-containing protein [Aliikangiella coralliicola]|uniref:SPOR domain-containing protein n=1 Tax=Aliikangiella coralliicola TaxID=2592383 RepID=UPI00143D683E|nr:SPOR domain-containing protein [Aliikangiella coralliicola]
MENSLKQRIVGAIVLIALAVIFLPSILKEKSKTEPFQTQIPDKPASLVENKVPDEVVDDIQQTRKTLDKLENSQRKSKTTDQKSLADNQSNSSTSASQEKAVEPNTELSKSTKTEIKTVKSDVDKTVPAKVVPKKIVKQSPENQKVKTAAAETIGPQFKDAAWVIQVASFSSKDNAVRMVEKLKKAGHKAYRRKGTNGRNKSIYRIFVGPFIEKSRAAKDLDKVAKVTDNKGILLPFDPTRH